MPRYHTADTGIKLCVWDPQQPNIVKTEPDQQENTHPPSGHDAVVNCHGARWSKKEEKSGPAMGHIVDDLKEEYFAEHEGLDFLGFDMPFYLVMAGKELFATQTTDEDQDSNTTALTATATARGNKIENASPLSEEVDTYSSLS